MSSLSFGSGLRQHVAVPTCNLGCRRRRWMTGRRAVAFRARSLNP
jgi:hypothetical protein